MSDMLVKLYELPDLAEPLARQRAAGIDIRRALVPEQHVVIEWVRANWRTPWASECAIAFARQPVSCFLAIEDTRLVGFACYEVTCRNFFGPLGVLESYRGRDIGAALLLASLHGLAALGYAYAIIGAVGPAEFYTKTVGATLIADSAPSVLRGMLRVDSGE